MAPPRQRSSNNRDVPDNLYPNGAYWRYRNPITGKVTSINKPLAEAIKLARAANAKLAPLMADDGQLLALLAPIVMSFLAQKFAQQGNAGQLSQALGQEAQSSGMAGGGLGALLDQDGDGQFGLGDVLKIGGGLLGKRP